MHNIVQLFIKNEKITNIGMAVLHSRIILKYIFFFHFSFKITSSSYNEVVLYIRKNVSNIFLCILKYKNTFAHKAKTGNNRNNLQE